MSTIILLTTASVSIFVPNIAGIEASGPFI